jgi:hypothetical protein
MAPVLLGMGPYPREWNVKQGRDEYLRENGWTLEAYDAPVTEASVFRIPLRIPNTPQHRWGIMLHDLHHVATGYGTDLAGEAEISAWELRRGLRGLGGYVGSLVVAGFVGGLLVAPRRTMRAWRRGPGRESLFQTRLTYEALLGLSVGKLRELLGVPSGGVAQGPQRLHSKAARLSPST